MLYFILSINITVVINILYYLKLIILTSLFELEDLI